jgi:hypothetical protein
MSWPGMLGDSGTIYRWMIFNLVYAMILEDLLGGMGTGEWLIACTTMVS